MLPQLIPRSPFAHFPHPLSHGLSESATTIQTSAWLKALPFSAIRLLAWSKQRLLPPSLSHPPAISCCPLSDRQRLMHFCNRSNVGNLKPSNKLSKNAMQTERSRRVGIGGAGAVLCNVGKTQSPWPDYRANFLWPTRRMREVRRRGATGGSKRKHCNGE